MSRYIDAEKLIAKLHSGDNYATILPPAIREIEEMLIDEMVGYVNETPTAEVKPIVRGKWLHRWDDYIYIDWLECSNCKFGSDGEVRMDEDTPFCPNCGADMRKESEDKE